MLYVLLVQREVVPGSAAVYNTTGSYSYDAPINSMRLLQEDYQANSTSGSSTSSINKSFAGVKQTKVQLLLLYIPAWCIILVL